MNHEKISMYLDALDLSGSYEEQKASVCILGNTGVGKTSLVKSLEKGEQFLSEKNKEYIDTQILNRVENVFCKNTLSNGLTVKKVAVAKLQKVTRTEEKVQKEDSTRNSEKVKITFLDFGGHTEYFTC